MTKQIALIGITLGLAACGIDRGQSQDEAAPTVTSSCANLRGIYEEKNADGERSISRITQDGCASITLSTTTKDLVVEETHTVGRNCKTERINGSDLESCKNVWLTDTGLRMKERLRVKGTDTKEMSVEITMSPDQHGNLKATTTIEGSKKLEKVAKRLPN